MMTATSHPSVHEEAVAYFLRKAGMGIGTVKASAALPIPPVQSAVAA